MAEVSSAIAFLAVPEIAKKSRPWAQVVDVGPPPGAEDDCGTANSLVEGGKLGPFTVNEWRTFFKPTPEQVEILKNGGSIAFVMLSGQMVAHHAEVWPGGSNTEPAATPSKVVLHYTDKTHDECYLWTGRTEGELPTLENLSISQRAVQLAERIEVVMSDGNILILKNRGGMTDAPSS